MIRTYLTRHLCFSPVVRFKWYELLLCSWWVGVVSGGRWRGKCCCLEKKVKLAGGGPQKPKFASVRLPRAAAAQVCWPSTQPLVLVLLCNHHQAYHLSRKSHAVL